MLIKSWSLLSADNDCPNSLCNKLVTYAVPFIQPIARCWGDLMTLNGVGELFRMAQKDGWMIKLVDNYQYFLTTPPCWQNKLVQIVTVCGWVGHGLHLDLSVWYYCSFSETWIDGFPYNIKGCSVISAPTQMPHHKLSMFYTGHRTVHMPGCRQYYFESPKPHKPAAVVIKLQYTRLYPNNHTQWTLLHFRVTFTQQSSQQ